MTQALSGGNISQENINISLKILRLDTHSNSNDALRDEKIIAAQDLRAADRGNKTAILPQHVLFGIEDLN
ncbi:hypothetical protein NECAME_05818 [Necator americanus]|uniref:Uncharacterized protein n=1 Tax=Necator americanus TaxID=51031 RepID=W2U0F9_NECAM|nr:hypothetical protein NECAME_05818 [Necator americanus]ETN86826.1 hypothetical protein NECAME_05818 [Necator americanus]